MFIEVPVPSNINARGRNGWFTASSVSAMGMSDGCVQVELCSARSGLTAPIILTGPAHAVKTLLEETLDAVVKTIKAGNNHCIDDGCGARFDSSVPEQRDVNNLKPFWQSYCPKHR